MKRFIIHISVPDKFTPEDIAGTFKMFTFVKGVKIEKIYEELPKPEK